MNPMRSTPTPFRNETVTHESRHALQVAVVVVNWNRREDTLACLSSLRDMVFHQSDIESVDLILVDNGSTDGTVTAVAAQFPKVELITLSTNLGFAAGCNAGLRHALQSDIDYVFLVNNDAVVTPDTLDQLLAVTEKRPDVGLAAPVIYRLGTSDEIWSAGYRVCPITLSAQSPIGNPLGDEPYLVDQLYGTGLLIRRRVLQDVGLFDERFFMYYEDVDLCRRAQHAGYRLMVVPSAHMWHKVSASTGEGSPALLYHLGRSSVFFFAKHTPLPLGPCIIMYRIGVAIKKLILNAGRCRWDVASAYVRGLVDGLKVLLQLTDSSGDGINGSPR